MNGVASSCRCFGSLWLRTSSRLRRSPTTTEEVVNKAPNGLALTPPMGWNSWNKFACDSNEQTVRDTADAMVAVGDA